MNENNSLGCMSLMKISGGLYCRIPAKVVRELGLRKGSKVNVYISTDRNIIKLVQVRDTIIIPDPAPARPAHIQQEPSPALEEPELISWVRRIFGEK